MKQLRVNQVDLQQAVRILLFVMFFCLSQASVMADPIRPCTEMAGSDYLQVRFSEPLILTP